MHFVGSLLFLCSQIYIPPKRIPKTDQKSPEIIYSQTEVPLGVSLCQVQEDNNGKLITETHL